MCGIAGVISKDMSTKDLDMFKLLMFMNQLRGMDSTGLFALDKGTSKADKRAIKRGDGVGTRTLKEAVAAQDFMGNRVVDRTVSTSKRALVGHTRAATVGSVVDSNAHPFVFSNLIGVMNGTASKHEVPGHEEFDTDTEAMFNYLNEEGIEEGLPKLLGLSRAPFALVFYDRKKNTLNFIRSETGNDTRPLNFGMSEDRKSLVFSSDPEMIRFCQKYTNYRMEMNKYTGEDGKEYPTTPKIWSYKANILVSIDVSVPTNDIFSSITTTELTPDRSLSRVSVSTNPTHGHNASYHRMYGRNTTHSTTSRTSNTEIIPYSRYLPDAKPAVVDSKGEWHIGGPKKVNAAPQSESVRPSGKSERIYMGPDGTAISFNRFKNLASKGCCCCSEEIDLTVNDVDKRVAWVRADAGWEITCEDCKDTPFMQLFIRSEAASK